MIKGKEKVLINDFVKLMPVMSTLLLAILTVMGGRIKNGSNYKKQPYPNTA